MEPEYLKQSPAWFHPRILVGPAAYLRPAFASVHNITHVMNCAGDEYTAQWFREMYPQRHHVLEAMDSPAVNIMSWYDEFDEVVTRFLQEEGNGTVYIHCHAGMNRSAYLTLAYCCSHFGADLDELRSSTLKQRPCMFQNSVFTTQVEDFIKNGNLPSQKSSRNLWNNLWRNTGLRTSRNGGTTSSNREFASQVGRGANYSLISAGRPLL